MFIVIPAKAGIRCYTSNVFKQTNFYNKFNPTNWIPAFAGMTGAASKCAIYRFCFEIESLEID